MKYLLLTTAIAATCLNIAAETIKTPPWRNLRYERSVTAPKTIATLGAVTFDKEIYDNTSIIVLSSDFRVIDATQHEVPFVIKQVKTPSFTTTKKSVKARILSLTKSDDNKKLELIIARPEKLIWFPVCELSIKTDQSNFEKRISVFGSNDEQTWKPLKQNTAIFDYSRIINLRNCSVTWKPADFKYFKLVIDNFQELHEAPGYSMLTSKNNRNDKSEEVKKFYTRRNFHIQWINLYSRTAAHIKTIKPALKEYPLKITSIKNQADNTIIEISTPKCPLTEFRLATSSKNFFRQVIVEGPIPSKRFGNRMVSLNANTSIQSFNLPGLNKKDLRIPFRGKRLKRYRITIINNNNRPLENISLKAYGHVYRAEFLTADLKQPLKVYYGGKIKIMAPIYDLSEIMDKLKNPTVCEFKMGEQMDNPEYEKSAEPADLKWLVWVAIGLIALVLILILGHNMKKFGDMEPDED
jgi:hypothetical protein